MRCSVDLSRYRQRTLFLWPVHNPHLPMQNLSETTRASQPVRCTPPNTTVCAQECDVLQRQFRSPAYMRPTNSSPARTYRGIHRPSVHLVMTVVRLRLSIYAPSACHRPDFMYAMGNSQCPNLIRFARLTHTTSSKLPKLQCATASIPRNTALGDMIAASDFLADYLLIQLNTPSSLVHGQLQRPFRIQDVMIC